MKRSRGRPAKGATNVIGLRLQKELDKALEGWMRSQKELSMTKQEAIRRILANALSESGDLKLEQTDQSD